jgi:hypothetical protein
MGTALAVILAMSSYPVLASSGVKTVSGEVTYFGEANSNLKSPYPVLVGASWDMPTAPPGQTLSEVSPGVQVYETEYQESDGTIVKYDADSVVETIVQIVESGNNVVIVGGPSGGVSSAEMDAVNKNLLGDEFMRESPSAVDQKDMKPYGMIMRIGGSNRKETRQSVANYMNTYDSVDGGFFGSI